MIMTIKQYAEREGVTKAAAIARLKRWMLTGKCEKIERGLYDIPKGLKVGNAGRAMPGAKIRRMEVLVRSGMKIWQVAVKLDVSPETVHKYCSDIYRATIEERNEKIAELAETCTVPEIADILNISRCTVRNICIKAGVKPQDGRKLRRGRRK